ncbi:helix-turn-helix transcriptional regulator [Kitasatospora sp. NPDC058170]|uniref:helix-turn-helix domain-containing protein n=1 Tax=Kitasatospora sp. NPDC058170 TaxID=3346364 RepID=UPI0036DAB71C
MNIALPTWTGPATVDQVDTGWNTCRPVPPASARPLAAPPCKERKTSSMTPRTLSRSADCPCGGTVLATLRSPRDLSVLTARESDVLLLLGSGLGNLPIALRLGITERTVKKHVTGVLGKLGVRSRLEAGLVAFLRHDHLCRQRVPPEAADARNPDGAQRDDREGGTAGTDVMRTVFDSAEADAMRAAARDAAPEDPTLAYVLLDLADRGIDLNGRHTWAELKAQRGLSEDSPGAGEQCVA